MLNPFARAARASLLKTSRIGAIALAAILVAACGSDEADTPPLFSSTVVFGASLTDTGNVCPASPGCPPTPPYSVGRFSNGTLFVETIAGRFGAAVSASLRGGNNFAYAGARTGNIPGLTTQSTTPSMVAQLDQFIARSSSAALLNPQTLFVVDASTFGNNFNAAVGAGLLPANATAVITAGVVDVVTIVTRLYAAGARNILLVNVPNLGDTPLVRAQEAVAPGSRAGATQVSGGFNQALAGQVTLLVANSPGLKVYTLDFFTLSNQITANPSAFGLTNVTDACVTTTSVCATPDTHLYWDSFHPTRATGQIAATTATTPPLPSP
jgi:outer membrane lipase/esterase